MQTFIRWFNAFTKFKELLLLADITNIDSTSRQREMAPVAIVVPVKNGNYIPDSFLTFVFIMTWALAQIESFRQKKAVTEQTVHPNKNDKMQTNPLFVSTQNQN